MKSGAQWKSEQPVKTMASTAFKMILARRSFCPLLRTEGKRLRKHLQDLNFESSKTLVPPCLLRVVAARQKGLLPFCPCVIPDSQENLETAVETENQEIHLFEQMVHLKFQIEKECCFGEQIMIVGNDPLLGSWDPDSAVSLNWSDGHVWRVELDLPVGRTFLFKFILRRMKGDILWQPGPDRIFETCINKKTIVILEDWDNVALRKLMEEDPSLTLDMIVNDNDVTHQGSDLMISNQISVPLDASHIETTPIAADSIVCEQENTGALVADNITCPDLNNYLMTKLLEEDHPQLLINNIEEPVLVPGLSSESIMENETMNAAGGFRSKAVEVSEEVEGVNILENPVDAQSDGRNESENSQHEEKMVEAVNDTEIKGLGVDEEEQEAANEVAKVVFESDVQWIQKTTQKLLRTFKFL